MPRLAVNAAASQIEFRLLNRSGLAPEVNPDFGNLHKRERIVPLLEKRRDRFWKDWNDLAAKLFFRKIVQGFLVEPRQDHGAGVLLGRGNLRANTSDRR